jgi:outer membrane protein OmpA-like peptidoglycan-associated protein
LLEVLMTGGMPAIRPLLVVLAALGVTSPLAGCATRHFVRGETERSQTALRPTVDQLAGDFAEHRTGVRGVTVTAVEAARFAEEATRSAIEARGLADVAASRATEALDRAIEAVTRADEAEAVAAQALAEADQTAQRLTRVSTGGARLAVVETIALRFGAGEWELDDRGRAGALDVVKRLRENPALVVHLEGHADEAGALPRNLRVSQWRAEAVARFLVEHGVEAHRLRTIGLGSSRPAADHGSREGRRQTRGVVVRLLDPL